MADPAPSSAAAVLPASSEAISVFFNDAHGNGLQAPCSAKKRVCTSVSEPVLFGTPWRPKRGVSQPLHISDLKNSAKRVCASPIYPQPSETSISTLASKRRSPPLPSLIPAKRPCASLAFQRSGEIIAPWRNKRPASPPHFPELSFVSAMGPGASIFQQSLGKFVVPCQQLKRPRLQLPAPTLVPAKREHPSVFSRPRGPLFSWSSLSHVLLDDSDGDELAATECAGTNG
jgi:hypothetical protein